EFFREGIAEFVIGGDDSNAGHTEAIPTLAQDSDTLLKNLAFADGYLNTYAYPAGYMFLRYLCKQTANNSIYFMENSTQTADFNGNNTVINNFSEGNKVNYNTTFSSAYSTKDGNDFVVETNDGNILAIRDAADKTINFAVGNENVYGYMTSTSGSVGTADLENFSVILGANYKSNDVYAGRGGSFLWGGFGGNDNLFGGNGADTFVYGFKGGNDTVQNAETQDIIRINDTTLEQISLAQITDGGVNLQFVDGGSFTISGTPSNFVLASENKIYKPDYQTKTWSA
ncbi:MAG: hypothetical protein IJQ16_02425, partial [Selenomonadaceae bacterium]|nr:hypothetical protein [Selenomonadaceae bacterium]